MIKITIDDREVKKMLRDLASRVKDRRPLMREIAEIMHDAVMENFEQEGRPKWKPSKRAQKQGGQTLQDTGSLAASISSRHDNNSAQVGTNKKYAAIHQFGGKAGRGTKVTIPARPFLKLTDSDLEEIKEAVKEYLKPL
jgi:phage virion morphogenesis protein